MDAKKKTASHMQQVASCFSSNATCPAAWRMSGYGPETAVHCLLILRSAKGPKLKQDVCRHSIDSLRGWSIGMRTTRCNAEYFTKIISYCGEL